MYPREGRGGGCVGIKSVHVERPSQKAIIIGKGGSRLKAIGSIPAGSNDSSARGPSTSRQGGQDWQRDQKQLGRLGFD